MSLVARMRRRRNIRIWIIVSLVVLASVAIIFILQLLTADGPHKGNTVQLKLDRRGEPEDWQLLAAMAREIPSLPVEFMQQSQQRVLQLNDTCAPFPGSLEQLQFHNNYWQSYRNGDVSYQLFGAYYDRRASLQSGPVVRLLAMVSQLEPPFPASHCQLWYAEQDAPAVVPLAEHTLIWPEVWGQVPQHLYPVLLTCVPPPDLGSLAPQTVSLVADPCARATNNLKVHFEAPPPEAPAKRGFAVCMKGLDYPYVDVSARLVEWLELLRLQGVDKVIMYELQLHANNSKVLRHYQQKGLVELRPLSLARGEPTLPHVQHKLLRLNAFNKCLHELIPYNDCFYRNMYKYEYIAAMDLDEVIMPLGNLSTWQQLVSVSRQARDSECEHFVSHCLCNVYFPDYAGYPLYNASAAPEYLYMMQHVRRMVKPLDPGLATKCLHNTDFVLTLHNHFPLHWMGSCAPATVNTSVGQLHHYREPDYGQQLEDFVLDANIWRYRKPLVQRTQQVLRELGYLPEAPRIRDTQSRRDKDF